MIEYWDYFTYGYEAPSGGQGTASTLPHEASDDVIERLHAVVAEVTGKPVDKPVKPRMGFM